MYMTSAIAMTAVAFCSIEPKVGVNHGGTVLMREVLDFGKDGYVPLNEDSDPNFLGETMTASEFVGERNPGRSHAG